MVTLRLLSSLFLFSASILFTFTLLLLIDRVVVPRCMWFPLIHDAIGINKILEFGKDTLNELQVKLVFELLVLLKTFDFESRIPSGAVSCRVPSKPTLPSPRYDAASLSSLQPPSCDALHYWQ